jgi:hypothetical protein
LKRQRDPAEIEYRKNHEERTLVQVKCHRVEAHESFRLPGLAASIQLMFFSSSSFLFLFFKV